MGSSTCGSPTSGSPARRPLAHRPTRHGAILGTLDFIAPEQLDDGPVDGRADVYALGCVLYYALCGRVPYPRKNDAQRMMAHAERAAARPARSPSCSSVQPGDRSSDGQAPRGALSARRAARRGGHGGRAQRARAGARKRRRSPSTSSRHGPPRRGRNARSATADTARRPGAPPPGGARPRWAAPGVGPRSPRSSSPSAPWRRPARSAGEPTRDRRRRTATNVPGTAA